MSTFPPINAGSVVHIGVITFWMLRCACRHCCNSLMRMLWTCLNVGGTLLSNGPCINRRIFVPICSAEEALHQLPVMAPQTQQVLLF